MLQFVKGDLFEIYGRLEGPVSIAHAVSADLHMGAGVATLFKKKFGRVDELLAQKPKVGQTIFIEVGEGEEPHMKVGYIVTKSRFFHKPTLENFTQAVDDYYYKLREMYGERGVSVCIPKIGAGLDKLNLGDVLNVVSTAADFYKLETTMVFLPDDEDFPGEAE
jgi:O-acetyl-ADP-ribose deacetylase (regulator of RNase III)